MGRFAVCMSVHSSYELNNLIFSVVTTERFRACIVLNTVDLTQFQRYKSVRFLK